VRNGAARVVAKTSAASFAKMSETSFVKINKDAEYG